MSNTLWVVIVLLLLWVYSWVQRLLLVLSEPLRHPKASVCDKQHIPKQLLAFLEQQSAELINLGFYYSHALTMEDVDGRMMKPNYTLVFCHPEHLCFAEVSNFDLPDHSAPASRSYRSVFTQGKCLVTHNLTIGTLLPSAPDRTELDTGKIKPKAQLEAHLKARSELTGEPKDLRPTLLAPAAHVQHMAQSQKNSLDHMLEIGAVKRRGNDLKLALTESLTVIGRLNKTIKQRKSAVNRLIDASGTSTLPDISAAETYAYEKLSEGLNNHRLDAMLKLVLFVASVAAFGLFFGLFTSFWFLPVLFAVLLFHELGHLLAMKVFGYKDLQILFLPIGAAALGTNNQATGLQRTLVYLAGPVPGLVLAWVMASMGLFTQTPWMAELIIMLLLINYINLLPVMPLDGGQIVNLVLFERSPKAHMAFLLISAIVFGASAWLLGFDPLLVVLAIITALMAFGKLGEIKIIAKVKNVQSSEDVSAQTLFGALDDTDHVRLSFAERMALVKNVITEYKMPAVGLPHKLISAALYLGALLLPLGLAYKTYESIFSPTDWEQEIADAAPEERNARLIQAGRSEMYRGEKDVGQGYLLAVLAASDPKATTEERRQALAELIAGTAYLAEDFDVQSVAHWLRELEQDGASQQLAETYITLHTSLPVASPTARQYTVKARQTYTLLNDETGQLRSTLALAQHDARAEDFRAADEALDSAWQMREVEQGWYLSWVATAILDRHALSGDIQMTQPRLDQLAQEAKQLGQEQDPDPELFDAHRENLVWVCLLGEDFACARQRLSSLRSKVESNWAETEREHLAYQKEYDEDPDNEYMAELRTDHFRQVSLLQTLLVSQQADQSDSTAAWRQFEKDYMNNWYNLEYFQELAKDPAFEGMKARLVIAQLRRSSR